MLKQGDSSAIDATLVFAYNHWRNGLKKRVCSEHILTCRYDRGHCLYKHVVSAHKLTCRFDKGHCLYERDHSS